MAEKKPSLFSSLNTSLNLYRYFCVCNPTESYLERANSINTIASYYVHNMLY